MEKENQRQYELTLVLSPRLEEKDIEFFEQEIEKDIKGLGGDLKKKGKLERRDLSYPIKKFNSGYYQIINFLFNPEKLEELSVVLKHKKDILRYMINFVEEPSFVKAEKDGDKARKKKKPELKAEKIREIAKEITEEEVEEIKKKAKEGKPKVGPPQAEKDKEVKLEEIDKKLEEILGI